MNHGARVRRSLRSSSSRSAALLADARRGLRQPTARRREAARRRLGRARARPGAAVVLLAGAAFASASGSSGRTTSRAAGARAVAGHRSLHALLRPRALPRRRARGAARGRLPARARASIAASSTRCSCSRTVGAMMLAAAGDLLEPLPRPRDDVARRLRADRLPPHVAALAPRRRSSTSCSARFAAALLLYGFALLYGATGHTDLVGIGAGASAPSARRRARSARGTVLIALVLVLVGLAFKVSAVPFHMWTPDAYEGAPTPATTLHGRRGEGGGLRDDAARAARRASATSASMSLGSGWPPVARRRSRCSR